MTLPELEKKTADAADHLAHRKRLALLILLTLSLAAFARPALAQVPATARNPCLHQDGTRIVDGLGREVKLRGVNLGGWMVWEGWLFGKGILTSKSTILNRLKKGAGAEAAAAFESGIYEQFLTEADVRKIAEAGFNCVRVPLHHGVFQGDTGWRLLDRLLGWCEKYRVYAVLDMHSAPGGQSKLGMADPGDARHLIWVSCENQQEAVTLWRAIAKRYRARQIVAGYDLLNEPAPPSGTILVDLYTRLIAAIRAEDPWHLIFLEGSQFATDFSMFEKPLCQNQAYSFHMYTWFGDDRKRALARFQELAGQQHVPLWVGEFGENTYEMMRTTVEMYEHCPEIQGWAYWTWKKAPNSSPGLATLRVPKTWEPVMASVGSLFGGKMPDEAQVKTGMRDFIEAVKFSNCKYDERMAKALRPR